MNTPCLSPAIATSNRWMVTLIIFLAVAACDTPHYLVIRCPPVPQYSITVYGRSGFLPSRKEDSTAPFRIHLETGAAGIAQDTLFFYGFGAWPGKRFMREHSRYIDSVIWVGKRGRQVLNDSASIERYLLQSRRGLFHTRLVLQPR